MGFTSESMIMKESPLSASSMLFSWHNKSSMATEQEVQVSHHVSPESTFKAVTLFFDLTFQKVKIQNLTTGNKTYK